jgi:hypothetical protein
MEAIAHLDIVWNEPKAFWLVWKNKGNRVFRARSQENPTQGGVTNVPHWGATLYTHRRDVPREGTTAGSTPSTVAQPTKELLHGLGIVQVNIFYMHLFVC